MSEVGRKCGIIEFLQDYDRFPCKDLKIIDKLWVHYSQGKFGFSVQKKIWEECGSPTGDEIGDWLRFCDRVGWLEGGEWMSYHELLKIKRNASLPTYYNDSAFEVLIGAMLAGKDVKLNLPLQ